MRKTYACFLVFYGNSISPTWVRNIVTVLLNPFSVFTFSEKIILSINNLTISGVSFFILPALTTIETKLFILSFISSYTFITRCKESGVHGEVVLLWDGHEEDKTIHSSKVDRGYTDFSKEFQLKEATKVNYLEWDFEKTEK